MEQLIETFHLDIKLIIAQLVNFFIVLAVLWYVALKPLLKIMDERSQTIEESLRRADVVEKMHEGAKEEQEKILKTARREAHVILEEGEKRAEQEQERIRTEAKERIAELVSSAKKQILSEKEKASRELKRETAELIIRASTKILKEHTPKDINKVLVEETLKKI